MATVELDPVFVKALKLLHSKAKDSGAQLKALLDDAIAQRKGLKPAQSGDAGKSSPARSKTDDDSKKKDAEKRHLEKGGKDSSEPDAKKSKLDSKRAKEEKEAKEREKEKERARREKDRKEKEERENQRQKEKAEKERKEKELASAKVENEVTMISDEEEPASQMDAGDFALEMGIACVICKQFDVSSGNQLLECQECHSLYHQECHKPPVVEQDVSDPRFVWYCSRCAKSLKKMVAQKPVKPKPTLASTTTTTKELTSTSSKVTKPETHSSTSQAFRKIDPKTIVTPKEASPLSSTTSKPMVGLLGLAANLAKPRGESKGGASSRKESKGDMSKLPSKSEGKTSSGNKSDSSTKSNSSTSSKSEDRKERKEDKDKDKRSDSSSKTSSKSDDKKATDSLGVSSKEGRKSPAMSSKEERKQEKTDKKSESGKSPSHSGLSKLDISAARSSPPQASTPTTPTTPSSPSSSKNLSSSASNKQAVANLSMVTANKRMQMMKKKAQAKPGDKKVHIK